MNSLVQGDPVRHRTNGWTGTVVETPSKLASRSWVNRNSPSDPYPELVPLEDLEAAE
ncbi:hypothetical protein ACFVVU_08620 [Kitasatospora sp. NPDC057965]|uniref:hypothetical protein n=1 Tax=Kitasatospora sp. NPDC057965 TaxID=3346291 RepID=UPI0036D9DBBB